MLSACKANLAIERRNLELFKCFLNSPVANPREKEFLELLVFDRELGIKNSKKLIKHFTTGLAISGPTPR